MTGYVRFLILKIYTLDNLFIYKLNRYVLRKAKKKKKLEEICGHLLRMIIIR